MGVFKSNCWVAWLVNVSLIKTPHPGRVHKFGYWDLIMPFDHTKWIFHLATSRYLRWRWMKLEIRAAVQPRSPGHQGELSNLDIWSSNHLNPDPNLALGLGSLSWRISGEDSDYVLVLSQCRSLKLSDILIPIDLMPSFDGGSYTSTLESVHWWLKKLPSNLFFQNPLNVATTFSDSRIQDSEPTVILRLYEAYSGYGHANLKAASHVPSERNGMMEMCWTSWGLMVKRRVPSWDLISEDSKSKLWSLCL